jgi:hypothetical protein
MHRVRLLLSVPLRRIRTPLASNKSRNLALSISHQKCRIRYISAITYLVQVDNRPPELALGFMEISHADFTKVTRVVLVEVGAVVMLSTCHAAPSGVLAVLAHTAVAGGDMSAAVQRVSLAM